MPLLAVNEVGKSFGGLRVLDGCSLTVERGSITGLIGPQRFGEDDAVQHPRRRTAGRHRRLLFDGELFDGLSRWQRSHHGLGAAPADPELFPRLTALGNVVAGVRGLSLSGPGAPP